MLVVLLQRRHDGVAFAGERDDVEEQVAATLGLREPLEAILFNGPHAVQLGQDLLEWPQLRVAGRLAGGEFGGVGGAEVGPVAAEDGDPLLARLVEVGGDKVGGVGSRPRVIADVGRRGAGVLADHQVRGGDGVALRAVRGGGVGELDMLA